LLQFSTLELGSDIEPVYRRHLDAILAALTRNFETWSGNYGIRKLSPQVTVSSIVATVFLMQHYPVFSGSVLPFPSVESAAASYAELWHRVFCNAPPAGLPTSDIDPAGGQRDSSSSKSSAYAAGSGPA